METSINRRDPCPTHDQLWALAASRVTGKAATVLADHVAECATCASALLALRASSHTLATGVVGGTATGDPTVGGERRETAAQGDDRTRWGPSVPQGVPAPASESDVTLVGQGARVGEPSLGRFAGYELISEIARGGMGVVYRAKQEKPERIVALKMILSGQLAAREEVERFYAETEAAAQLDHRGIVPVYEVGSLDGRHFFTMPFVDGNSLAVRVARDGPLPAREAADMAFHIADAVAYAHSKNIVHRDLKPANILIGPDGHPRITDFGLARRVDVQRDLTVTGQVIGTPSYMAPEQAAGLPHLVGPAVDIYAVGAILYFLLTGRPPFQASSLYKTLDLVRQSDPVHPRLLNPAVDRDIETICLKCLEKSPAARYGSAAQLAEDLARFLAGDPISARAITRPERAWRWCRRHPWSAALIGMTTVALALLIVGFAYRQRADYWRRTAELQGKISAQQRQLAERNQELADLATAMRHMLSAEKLAVRRNAGWSWQALEELEQAARLAGPRLDEVQYRSLAAQCLSAVDVRLAHVVAVDVLSANIAFTPDSRAVAVAQMKGVPQASVYVYELAGGTREATYQVATALGNATAFLSQVFQGNLSPRFQESLSGLAFSPDGRWLAAGSRMGKIYLWDRSTTAAAPQTLNGPAGEEIKQVGFSADSRTLYGATSAPEHGLAIWQGSDEWKLAPARAAVRTPWDWSPDRERIAYRRDGRIVVEPREFQSDLASVSTSLATVRFTRDGRMLAGGEGAAIALVDARTGTTLRRLGGDEKTSVPLNGRLELVEDCGLVVATSHDDEWVRLIDLASGQTVGRLISGGRSDPPITVSPDGHWLAVAGETAANVYEIRRPDVHSIAVHARHAVEDIALSRDGRRLIYSAHDWEPEHRNLRHVRLGIVELERGQRVGDWMVHAPREGRPFRAPRNARVGSVALDDSGKWIATQCGLTGFSWRAGTTEHWPRQMPAQPTPAQRIDDADFAWAEIPAAVERVSDAEAVGGTAVRLAAQGEPRPVVVPLPREFPRPADLVLAARVRCVPSGTAVPRLVGRLLDREFHVELDVQPAYQWVQLGVVESGDSGAVWQEGAARGLHGVSVSIQADAATTREIWLDQLAMLPCSPHADGAAMQFTPLAAPCFSPDSQRIYAVVDSSHVVSWNGATGEQVAHFDNQSMSVLAGQNTIKGLTAGRKSVVAGTETGHVVLLDPATLQIQRGWSGPSAEVTALALSADESWLAVGNAAGELHVLRTADAALVAKLPSHAARVTSVQFEASGALWTSSWDGSIRRWTAEGGSWRESLVLSEAGGPVEKIQVDAAGANLVAHRTGEHVVHHWRLKGGGL
ncbi:MAG: WD40 repeat domain-containing serine/threonine protein kinase [Pirellulaceae bacterium]